MSERCYLSLDDDDVVIACDDCQSIDNATELHEVKDLLQRVEPGGMVPAGECKNCGALCYPKKVHPIRMQEEACEYFGVDSEDRQELTPEESMVDIVDDGGWVNIRVFIPLALVKECLK